VSATEDISQRLSWSVVQKTYTLTTRAEALRLYSPFRLANYVTTRADGIKMAVDYSLYAFDVLGMNCIQIVHNPVVSAPSSALELAFFPPSR
jgi:hypothetical protein